MAVSSARRFIQWRVEVGLILFLMLAMLGNGVASAAGPPMDAAKAKQKVTELGTSAVWRVAMRDGRTVTGEVIAVRDDDFDLRTKKAPVQPISIRYDQVEELGSPIQRKQAIEELILWALAILGGLGFALGQR